MVLSGVTCECFAAISNACHSRAREREGNRAQAAGVESWVARRIVIGVERRTRCRKERIFLGVVASLRDLDGVDVGTVEEGALGNILAR